MEFHTTILPARDDGDVALDHLVTGIESKLGDSVSRRVKIFEQKEARRILATLKTFYDLSRASRRNVILNPTFIWWFLRILLGEDTSSWFLELGRLILGTAIDDGCLNGRLVTRTNSLGELRFPGLRGYICLGPSYASVPVILTWRGNYVGVRAPNLQLKLNRATLTGGDSSTSETNVRFGHFVTGTKIEVDSSDPWIVHYLRSNARNLPVAEYGPEQLSEAAVDDAFVNSVSGALSLLRDSSPDFSHELNRYVRLIVPFHSSTLSNFSDKQLFGAIFIRQPQGKFIDRLTLLEQLVHETGHQRLYLLQSREALHRSPTQTLLRSPLRKDLRPVDGVFHAVFVLTRVAIALSRISEPGAQTRALVVGARAKVGIEAIRRGASLTEAGAALLTDAEKHIAEFEAHGQIRLA